jgi:hypothetical protein
MAEALSNAQGPPYVRCVTLAVLVATAVTMLLTYPSIFTDG